MNLEKIYFGGKTSFVPSPYNDQKINYHQTIKKPVTDLYFGYEIKDNYRWLEDDLSPETEEWVYKQNQTTFKYLNQIPFRKDLKKDY